MTSDAGLSPWDPGPYLAELLGRRAKDAAPYVRECARDDQERISRFFDAEVSVGVDSDVCAPVPWVRSDPSLVGALRCVVGWILEDRSVSPSQQMELLRLARGRADAFRRSHHVVPLDKLKEIFSVSPVAFLLFDKGGQVLWSNRETRQILGYDPVEVLEGHLLPAWIEANHPSVLEPTRRIFSGEPAVVSGLNLVSTFSGRELSFTAQSVPLFDSTGRLTHVGVVLVDESERRALTERLDRSQQVLAGILDAIADPVLTCDKRWRLSSWNRAASTTLGLDAEDAELALTEAVLRCGGQLAAAELDEALVGGQEMETRLNGAGGKVPYGVRVWAIPASLSEGSADRRVVVLRDRRAELERQHRLRVAAEQLAQVNRELRDLNEAKIKFMNIVSHELRSPLVTIRGYIEMILRERLGELTAPQREGLQIAFRNTISLTDQIETLLDFSRLEQGRMQFSLEPLALVPMLHKVLDAFRDVVSGRGLKFELSIAVPDGVMVMADSDKLQRVVRVLLNNAIKFTPEGAIGLRVHPYAGAVLVSVWDTGHGIEAEELDHVFDTFYQVQRGSQERIRSVGLGLSVARDLVAGHGGELRVQSEPGEGSTFSFMLELAP